MQVKIQCRTDGGRYRSAVPGEFAEASIIEITSMGGSDGWWFLRLWLCKVFLKLAARNPNDSANADRWIYRYQKIREIV